MTKKQRELTQAERELILKDTPPYIKKCGVKNHERAKYISMISKEVIGSTNNKFISMQPQIRDHHDYLEWNMAYAIVTNFLKDNNCKETLNVIDYEFDNKLNPINHPDDLSENYAGNSTDFETLLEYIPTKTEAKFSTRLQKFLPYLTGIVDDEEDFDNVEIENVDGAFLTQPAETQGEKLDEQDGVISMDGEEEEDEGELFSITDINSDSNPE